MNCRRLKRWAPVSLVAQGVILLCLAYVIAPIGIFLVSGTPFDSVGVELELLRRAVNVCLLMCVLGVYQRLICSGLSNTRDRWAVRRVLVLLLLALFCARSVWCSLPSVRAQQILANGGLAGLPESATVIAVYTWWTPFSGEEYLKFEADREDIERFVAEAAILEGAEHQDYSRGKMRLVYRGNTVSNDANGTHDHEYIWHHPSIPPWYMEEVRCRARLYRIRPPGYHHAGEVIIDQDNNVVFVKLVFS